MGQRWEVIGKHQRRDLADRFIGDLCNDSPDVRRHCLKALGELFPLQELAAKIGAALASCDWPRVLEVYTDIVRLKKLRDKRVEMRDAIAAFLSADESLLLDAIAFMADAETAEDLKNFLPPTNLSEIKLAATKTDGVAKAYLLRILASANVNVVPLVENVITIGTEEVVGGALDALYAQASREAIDQICRALGHPSYRIRRHAMRLLAATEEQNISQLVLSMAADRSAPVREACATIIGEQLWSDGLPLLMKLLSDNRNYERGYETWTKYNVARAAAKALGRYESHPQETIQAICGFLDGGRVSSEDVIVHALLCYTLAQNPQPEITFRLISGLRNPWHIGREGNLRYPIRIASARALAQLFARARDLPLSELDMKQIINSGLASDARVAAPALMACGFRVETTLPLFQAAVVQQQTQLLRIVLYLLSAASVQNRVPDGDLDRILPNSHPILEILKQNPGQEAAPPSPGLLNWIMTLKSSRSVERSILYLLSQHWKIPIEDFPTLPWDDDNLEPKEIPVMTLRSMFGGE